MPASFITARAAALIELNALLDEHKDLTDSFKPATAAAPARGGLFGTRG